MTESMNIIKKGGAALGLLAIVGAIALSAMPTGAEATGVLPNHSCPFVPMEGRTIVQFDGTRLVSSETEGWEHATGPTSVSLPAGKYKVTLFSFDGYYGREDVSQPHEQWYVKFMSGSTLVASSNAVSDIPDNVQSATRNEVVNSSLTLSSDVTKVVAFHAYYVDNSSPNSVVPICAAFDRIVEIPALSLSCSASKSTVDIGESVTYTANPSGGTGSYAYSWSGTNSLTGSTKSVSKSYSSAGAKTATVTVTSGDQTLTKTCNVTVVEQVPELNLTCSANKTIAETGESVTYTANPTGGNGSYAYSWTGTNNLTGSTKSVSKSYSTAGTKTATVTVTSNGESLTKSCSVVIEEPTPSLELTCSANRSVANTGDPVVYTANVAGGNGSYAFAWSGSENLSGSNPSVTKSYSNAGAKTATVTVTSNGESLTRTCNVQVNEPTSSLSGSCAVNPSHVRIGEQATWTASASGGTGFYTYRWENNLSFFGSSREVSTSYSTPGTKYITVRITSGDQSIVKTCSVIVDEPEDDLTGSCSADTDRIDTGDSVTWRASASGGTGSYTYDWSGTNGLSGTSRTISKTYSSEGTKYAEVRITSGTRSVVRSCSVIVDEEEDDLGGSCSADRDDARTGEEVTFTARGTGGDGDYRYEWEGTDGLDDSGRIVRMTYDSTGSKRATVRITSDGRSVTRHCYVDITRRNNPTVTVYTTPETPVSQVYLSQVPYTGPMDNWKISLYVMSFLLWSAGISFYVLKRKYGIDALAMAGAKAGEWKDELSERISGLRTLRMKRPAVAVEEEIPQWEKVKHLFQR